MKQYYYHNGVDKFGPFSKEELHAKGITLDTQVWCEGMAEWAPARNVSELNALFVGAPAMPAITPAVPPVTPPPAAAPVNNNMAQQQLPPSTNLIWGILTTIFCCLPFGIVSIVYACKVESTFYSGNVTMAREYSKLAGRWALIAAIVGFVVFAIYFLAVGAELMYFMAL
ncbi:MAG: CD225/dispanin family protein [Rikenellaceae bacterium]